VQVTVLLPANAFREDVSVTARTSATQLISSLVGLFGALTIFRLVLRATEKSRAAVVLLAERRRAARERKRQLRAVKAADGPHPHDAGKHHAQHPAGAAAAEGEAAEAGRPQLQLRRPQRLHDAGKDGDDDADEGGRAPQGAGNLSTRDVIAAGVGVASAAAGIATEVLTSSASS